MVNKAKRDELVDAIIDLCVNDALTKDQQHELAVGIVDIVIQKGWQWHPVNPIVEEEIDMIDRIISGLPPRPTYQSLQWPPHGSVAVVEPHPSHEGIADVKLYDVNSLYPQEVSNWTRIPTWDNYEINGLGQVRNRWTKRILDYVDDGEDNEDYVEMHDKEGYTHMCHVGYLKEQTFGA